MNHNSDTATGQSEAKTKRVQCLQTMSMNQSNVSATAESEAKRAQSTDNVYEPRQWFATGESEKKRVHDLQCQ